MRLPLSVLICEPVVSVADSLSAIFCDDHITVVTSGHDTQQLLESSPPDILLLDMFPSDMDAFDFLGRVHLLGLAPSTRIIVLSPTDPDSLFEKLYSFGVTAVIRRTDELSELRAQLRPLLPAEWGQFDSGRPHALFVGSRRASSKPAETAALKLDMEFYSSPTLSNAKRLLDVVCPDVLILDADECLGQMTLLIEHARLRNSKARFIVIAGKVEPLLRSRLAEEGLDICLRKPCTEEDFRAALLPSATHLNRRADAETKSVLIVEDSSETAHALQETVEQYGWCGVVAESAERALELLPSNGFSAMVLDLGLPGMDGVELLARLRHRGMQIPCVVVSASRNQKDLKLLSDLGIREFFEKPVKLDSIMAAISAPEEK